MFSLKGVSSKPSGNLIAPPIFFIFRVRDFKFGILAYFLLLCKVSWIFDNVDIRHFIFFCLFSPFLKKKSGIFQIFFLFYLIFFCITILLKKWTFDFLNPWITPPFHQFLSKLFFLVKGLKNRILFSSDHSFWEQF